MNNKMKFIYVGICASSLYIILTIFGYWLFDGLRPNRVGPVGTGGRFTTSETVLFIIRLIGGICLLVFNILALISAKRKM
ncbi:hypothetical protein CBW46_016900 [Paenibacillus xerothermodurans]|uniref:Uncharacterized protein n=1 Tax=Paenibacillus xerothermodurans TaxID=1977292 RepID=A0A2W1NPH0_PAEXE|nr:hypothetical protein CBW46_016900 [Paenibacillus xerothermodurans]